MRIMRQFLFLLLLFVPFSLIGGTGCPFDAGSPVIERQMVYETSYWMVLVDQRPVLPGHLLIVSRRHVTDRHQLTFEEHAELYDVERAVHKALQERYGPDTHDLQYEKNGLKAGQSVNHFHIHVYPMLHRRTSWFAGMRLIWSVVVAKPRRLTDQQMACEVEAYQEAFRLFQSES